MLLTIFFSQQLGTKLARLSPEVGIKSRGIDSQMVNLL